MDHYPPQAWQLRSDLEFSPQRQQGRSFVIVKDPVTARYFRFTEAQAAILALLRETPGAGDGSIDAPALARHASQQLGGSIPVATIGEALMYAPRSTDQS